MISYGPRLLVLQGPVDLLSCPQIFPSLPFALEQCWLSMLDVLHARSSVSIPMLWHCQSVGLRP